MRYKAWLVTQEFSWVYGEDYLETHAPVMWLETIRLLLAITNLKDWEVQQLNIKTAYLYGELEEEIYIEPPLEYNIPEGHVFLLIKALYGLRQAG